MSTDKPVITLALLNQLKSRRGGYTREALEILGISWPPRRGWRKALMRQAQANEAKAQASAADAEAIKKSFASMSDVQRAALMEELAEEYCRHCWSALNGTPCFCTRDE